MADDGASQFKLFNTRTRRVEDFCPINSQIVSLYTCGPTVYNFAHIGNLRTYIFEDILKRALFYAGYKVKHVMNVTDVGHLVSDADVGDDKMELSAKKENKTIFDLANFYFQAFREDLQALNIIDPDIWCKATEHIEEQVDFIQKLEQKGFTYIIDDGVYFDTSKFKNYGQLANLDIQGLKAGARIEVVKGKKNITDFALWKFSPKGQKRLMEWDSPWGIGFPGWHIECSAMAMKYLGERIDIHCGGIDHIPVHHTNEIAQSESLTGHRWVNWWVHGEFLGLDKKGSEEKMSKSAGNFITVKSLAENGIRPLGYRYFCLNAHYRKPLTFSWEAIKSADIAFRRLQDKVIEYKKDNTNDGVLHDNYLHQFDAALLNDLNVPKGLGIMWDLINDHHISPPDKLLTLMKMDSILGLGLPELTEAANPGDEAFEEEVKNLIEKRNEARQNKNYRLSDQIRDELGKRGFIVEDTQAGTVVKRKG